MKKFSAGSLTGVVCLVAFLFISQMAVADYILTSGSNDTGANGGQSIIRYTDNFQVVWERSPALGTAETTVFTVEISPLNGDVYTTQVASPQLGKHLSYVDGTYIGRPIPTGGQTDGTGTYTAPSEAVQDIQFGYDYNKDGVADLWVCRRDTFEVYDGTTLNRTGDNGTADILTSLKIADSGGTTGVQDGTGGFGITFGPDLTGDGIGELYAMAVVNAATGSRLNVWNPVTITKVATYNIDGTRDNALIILGPDVNKDGKQDLWITDPRNHRIRAYDYATGALVAGSISLVKASEPATAVTLRFPTDIDFGPNGTILITTRFATSLDPQWTGPSDTAGGDLLQIQWDPVSGRGLTTLLFEYTRRLDSVAYIAPELKGAVDPYPANGATDVPRDVVLSWKTGKFADKHDVYFGTVFDDVQKASRTSPLNVLASQNQDANTYDPAGLLELEQTYYWRVDEVNAPPDYTVYKGNVWSFTAEPFAYPIKNITAKASSSQSADMGPGKTVDGSGLNASDQHSTVETAMWLSSSTGPQPTWIRYEFDRVYKLHQMWVWNYNQSAEPWVGWGMNNVTIEYSTDGDNWTQLSGVPEFAQATGLAGYTHNTTVGFGDVIAKYVKITANSNWGVLKQYGLSEVRFFYKPVHAREPKPASGQADVGLEVVLSWRAGREAAKHNVYFSESRQAVIDGTAPVTTVTEASYGPLSISLAKTYYWRVDEVNEAEIPTTWQGDVWDFTTQQYFLVDDFEQYNDTDNKIFDVWADYFVNNTGATVGWFDPPFAEKTIVHGGKQSMPYRYDNDGTVNEGTAYEKTGTKFYSEAEREWSTPQDWTIGGVNTLTLYFRGNPTPFLERSAGNIVMSAAGADIWGTSDEFRYAYKQLSGDGQIVTKVVSIGGPGNNEWRKAGVMIRESLDAGSRHAFMAITPAIAHGVAFQNRPVMNGDSVSAHYDVGLTAPLWVKLVRQGNQFTGYYSTNGVNWVQVPSRTASDGSPNPQTISMSPSAYIGLALTSHQSGVSCVAEFSDVTITGATGAWQIADIGVAQPGNDPAPMYVVLQDSANKTAIVTHSDPAATLLDSWQEWNIALTPAEGGSDPVQGFALAGLNLRAIKKLSIGVGDRANPQRGGSGRLYIDDIRLYGLQPAQ